MSYNEINDGINKAKQIEKWDSLIIKYNHRTHPNEYTCYKVSFATEQLLKETISNICDGYLHIVQKYNSKIEEYTGANSKNVIDKISIFNELVISNWTSLIQHVNDYDDTVQLCDIKGNAFIFAGTYKENDCYKNIYLLSRKNPVITFKKGRAPIFTSRNNLITDTDDPFLQFGKCFDALIYNNTIYMINLNCESILNMEYTHKKVCNKSLSELETLNIIKDWDQYSAYARGGHNPKRFVTYDRSIVEKLNQSQWRSKVENEIKIPIDLQTGKFDLSDPENARRFTSVVCGKLKSNIFDDGLCEVPTSTPLIFS